MKTGDVRVAEDSDFKHFRNLCDDDTGWKLELSKKALTVWTKANDCSDFKMVKVRTVFSNIPATTMYDVLHDSEYRKEWDKSMMEGHEICALNPNNDIGYYAVRCSPLKNRDFITQRSWLDLGDHYIIFNHSVNYEQYPPRKNLVRGLSHLTGYLVRHHESGGCQLVYLSHSDPRGKLPSWAVNKLTHFFAPKIISRIHKAASKYISWKSKHNPHYKPWINPEQMSLPRIDLAQFKPINFHDSNDSIDETQIIEDDFKDDADIKDGD